MAMFTVHPSLHIETSLVYNLCSETLAYLNPSDGIYIYNSIYGSHFYLSYLLIVWDFLLVVHIFIIKASHSPYWLQIRLMGINYDQEKELKTLINISQDLYLSAIVHGESFNFTRSVWSHKKLQWQHE